MNIENIKTSELIPYAKNAKLHSDAQVAAIASSIREFKFNNPVLIDKDNGIIAGHGRVLAAQLLKLEHVPCIRLAHLSDTQKRAYILADNRLAETGGGWNEELLKIELGELQELDFDLSLTGFDGEFAAEPLKNATASSVSGASPWDQVGKASDGVMFSFGIVQKRISKELYGIFLKRINRDNIEEWLNENLHC